MPAGCERETRRHHSSNSEETATARRKTPDRRCSMRKAQPKAYRLEYGEQALRRVQAETTPIRMLARESGIHLKTLRNWRCDARVAGYEPSRPDGLNVEEQNCELTSRPLPRLPRQRRGKRTGPESPRPFRETFRPTRPGRPRPARPSRENRTTRHEVSTARQGPPCRH